MRIIFIVLLVAMSTLLSFAQEEKEYYKNEFGAHAGFTSGVGLSYRHWFNRVGAQVTAIPIKSDNMFFGSLGLTGMYSLKRSKYVQAYLYLGNHFFTYDDTYYEYDPSTGYETEHKQRNTQYNIGFGPGFSFGRVVTFSLMVGYGAYDVMDRFNLLPTGEIGVYYMF